MTLKIFSLVFLTLCTAAQLFAQKPIQTPNRETLIAAAAPFERLSEVFRLSSEIAAPSIVHIEATQLKSVNPGGRSGRAVKMQVEESGSGIIATVADKQVILTNRHVVEGIELSAIKILTLDRHLLTPIRVITNEDFDIAVVEVQEPLPVTAKFADSDKVSIGEIVLAIGSPFGLQRSVSMGIVSSINRRNIPGTTETPRVGFFQIDAAVNPGSSGGPMLNLRGEVLGLVTAIATQGGGSDGIAFVLPAKFVLRVADQLVRSGTVVKPYVGLGFDPDFGSEKRKELGIDRQIGAKILRLVPDSPASQAGLLVSDIILSFDDVEVEDDVHIVNLVAQSEIDKPVKLMVFRDGKDIECFLTPIAQISR